MSDDVSSLPTSNSETPVSEPSLFMDKVYLMGDGVNEFTQYPGVKTQQFKLQVTKFRSAPTRPVSEFPLQMFSSWFADLPLSHFLKSNKVDDDSGMVWQFKVLLLYPTVTAIKKVDQSRYDWAASAAKEFYSNSFHEAADQPSIHSAVVEDPSIMVVGCQVSPDDEYKKSIIGSKDAVVISCITFRHGSGDECGSSLVLWLLVAECEASKPSSLSSWRRHGFGRFLLIMLIKRSIIDYLAEKDLAQWMDSPLPGADVYLQCTQAPAMAFYHACGFVRINDSESTGIDLLPRTIWETISDVDVDSGSNFAWIVPESDEERIIPLMRLRSGSLLNSVYRNASKDNHDVVNVVKDDPVEGDMDVKIDEQVNKKVPEVVDVVEDNPMDSHADVKIDGQVNKKVPDFVWCMYPLSASYHDAGPLNASELLRSEDMEAVFVDLPLLNEFLPPPISPLLAPHQMRNNGDLYSVSRLDHSRVAGGGTTWMKSAVLDMIHALLMRDGRYDASATIISCTNMILIQNAFEALHMFMSAKKFEKQLEKKKEKALRKERENRRKARSQELKDAMAKDDMTKIAELMAFVDVSIDVELEEYKVKVLRPLSHKKFGGISKDGLYDKYSDHMNHVLKHVLVLYPGILQKKLIVFPTNFGNSHWGATFVFNPGEIDKSVDDVSSCRSCIFRYCSLYPSGDRKVGSDSGIAWFLNLAYSYQDQQRTLDMAPSTESDMKWLTPFGQNFNGCIRGTKKFPSLRVLDKDVLPLQKDGHSCGIGEGAAVAIILRDIVGALVGNDHEVVCANRYNEMFSRETMVLDTREHEGSLEHVCYFPKGSFRPLPTSDSSDFLHCVKAEWFVVFDRLAELQFVTIPKRRNPDYVVNEHYLNLKALLENFPWPRSPIPYKEEPKAKPKSGEAPRSFNEDEASKAIVLLTSQTGSSLVQEDKVDAGELDLLLGLDSTDAGSMISSDVSSVDDMSLDKEKPGKVEDVVQAMPDEDQLVDGVAKTNKAAVPDGADVISVHEVFPPASKIWKGGPRKGSLQRPFIPDDYPIGKGKVALSRYKTFVEENDTEEFHEMWRNEDNESKEEESAVPRLNEKAMHAFVEAKFRQWKWSSMEQHKKELESVRMNMKYAIQRAKTLKMQEDIRRKATQKLNFMKKERKNFTKSFELEYKFGNAAMVQGLKYNPREDCFIAQLEYKVQHNRGWKWITKKDTIPVSEFWLKEADYSEGVLQHVINLGNTDEFVPIPSGKPIHINTKKVHSLRYVAPSLRWIPNTEARPRATSGQGKAMKSVPCAGYWEVQFVGEKGIMKVDDHFVSNFKKGFLDEVKLMRCGFVRIPVGDFKVSHLQEHPNLQVPYAPKMQFVQTEGEDLCVSKSLASAFYQLGFETVATKINEYGERELSGGTVDAVGKVRLYAETLLPRWIRTKVNKQPHLVDWKLLQRFLKDYIAVGVLNESDGNGSHAVTIHGNFVYDANEVVALPLCQEALDYCCSTTTVKNEFVNFRELIFFYYEGQDMNRKSAMTLYSLRPYKRKRDKDSDDEDLVVPNQVPRL